MDPPHPIYEETRGEIEEIVKAWRRRRPKAPVREAAHEEIALLQLRHETQLRTNGTLAAAGRAGVRRGPDREMAGLVQL